MIFKSSPTITPITLPSGTPIPLPPTAPTASGKVPVIATESQLGMGPQSDRVKLLSRIGGGLVSLVLIVVVWGLWPRAPKKVTDDSTVVPTDLREKKPLEESPPQSVNPGELLVLVGIGNLASDDAAQVLGMGWLWNERTVVVPRKLGDVLSELIVALKRQGVLRQACVIQGTEIEVAEIHAPPGCPEISILRLKTPAYLLSPAREQWQRVDGNEIERLRALGKTFRHLSFARFPNAKAVRGLHGFPIHEYDPGIPAFTRRETEKAVLEHLQRRHYLKSPDATKPLERGGLLLDEQQKIVGMSLPDLSVVWTEALQRALENP